MIEENITLGHIVHSCTCVGKKMIGEEYRLDCNGQIVYYGFCVTRWYLTDRPVTCKKCLIKKGTESD